MSRLQRRQRLADELSVFPTTDDPLRVKNRGVFRAITEAAIARWPYATDPNIEKYDVYRELRDRTEKNLDLGPITTLLLWYAIGGLISAVVRNLVDWWWENRAERTKILVAASDMSQ